MVCKLHLSFLSALILYYIQLLFYVFLGNKDACLLSLALAQTPDYTV